MKLNYLSERILLSLLIGAYLAIYGIAIYKTCTASMTDYEAKMSRKECREKRFSYLQKTYPEQYATRITK